MSGDEIRALSRPGCSVVVAADAGRTPKQTLSAYVQVAAPIILRRLASVSVTRSPTTWAGRRCQSSEGR